jgi:N-acetylneuraminate synthase
MTMIVAEIGINHNGNLDIARKLIEAARWAGADAVKFQKRTVGTVYAGQLDQPRESPWGKSLGGQKRGLEFDRLQWDLLISYCNSIKMPVFASAWDIEALDFIRKYDFPYNKIASAMVTNLPFVDAVSREEKPTLISTAMCTEKDISDALLTFQSEVTLMHCVATYPAREEDLNLNCIIWLRKTFGTMVGYSGHEASVSPSVLAALLGAWVIERHITLDRSMYGSDQAASLEPIAFWNLVNQIRKIPQVLGDGVKRILPAEQEVAKKLRYWER